MPMRKECEKQLVSKLEGATQNKIAFGGKCGGKKDARGMKWGMMFYVIL